MNKMGHNSIPDKLAKAAQEALQALGRVETAEDGMMAAWVAYGEALLVGKKLTEDPNCGIKGDNPDHRFKKWRVSSKLNDTVGVKVSRHKCEAAMWAAEDPVRFAQVRAENDKVRTVRGMHAKWKKAQKAEQEKITPPEAERETQPETEHENEAAPEPEPEPEPSPDPQPETERQPDCPNVVWSLQDAVAAISNVIKGCDAKGSDIIMAVLKGDPNLRAALKDRLA